MIATAVQNGSYVYVYDERGNQLYSKSGVLVGFTSTSVSVKNGNYVHVYDEKGNTMFSRSTY